MKLYKSTAESGGLPLGPRLAHCAIMRVLGRANFDNSLSLIDKVDLDLWRSGQPPSQVQTTLTVPHPLNDENELSEQDENNPQPENRHIPLRVGSVVKRHEPKKLVDGDQSTAAGWSSAVGFLAVYRLESSEKKIHSRFLRVSFDERHCVP